MAGRLVAASLVATLAFWSYTQTLLPGVDLGDTGGFQAAVLWPSVSARQAYPLYYNLARPFVSVTCGVGPEAEGACEPARALNLFSAIWAAAAVGLVVYLGAAITGIVASGIVAGLLLAFSYTFWSQAIIAEVYALHLALIAACALALHAYARKPGLGRIALFFALYAASFGNHLSMILFLPPFALFLVLTTPAPRRLLRPAVVGMALLFATAGALQYWPNFMSVAGALDAPAGWSERVAAFWFDTTKADWRESMVLGIRRDQALDRLAMWWFDIRQQFGAIGVALAAAGVWGLWTRARVWAITLLVAFAITTLFALTYNVGDSHVFFLPGHLITALFAGAAVVALGQGGPKGPPLRTLPSFVSFAIILPFVLWRGWSTWPAVDRHDDRRGEQLIAQLTLGISDPDAMLVSQMNWQLENVLLYTARYRRPDLTWARLGDVLPHFPFLVADQRAIARDVVLTADAAAEVIAAYGPLEPLVEDTVVPVLPLSVEVQRIPRGSPYVLALLTPPREESLDAGDLALALETLTGGHTPARRPGSFELIAGVAGAPPAVYRSADRPFSVSFRLTPEATADTFTVRIDSWLPSDTFRRPGFGHVLMGRRRVQILERGVNLVWVGRDGQPSPPIYAASLFAPKPRFRIPSAAPAQFAGSKEQDPADVRP